MNGYERVFYYNMGMKTRRGAAGLREQDHAPAGLKRRREYNPRNCSRDTSHTMKTISKVFGTLLFLTGLIWLLQGMGILPGSFMTGDPQWAINGAIAMVVGAGLFWFGSLK
jgi:hypothetical protein